MGVIFREHNRSFLAAVSLTHRWLGRGHRRVEHPRRQGMVSTLRGARESGAALHLAIHHRALRGRHAGTHNAPLPRALRPARAPAPP